jgi:hypothetical protein
MEETCGREGAGLDTLAEKGGYPAAFAGGRAVSWRMNGSTARLLAELEATRDETVRYFGLGPDDLARSYAPGKWSVRYILQHLTDSETVLYDRIRRVLSEPRQVIWFYDQDAWANALSYQERPLEMARRIYESVRAAMIYYAGLHYERNGHLEFVHSMTGVRTLRDEFDKTAAHNEHHLRQIRTALGSEGMPT